MQICLSSGLRSALLGRRFWVTINRPGISRARRGFPMPCPITMTTTLPNAAVHHVQQLWGRYWLLPGGLPVLYAAVVGLLGDLRAEHIVMAVLACALAYFSRRTQRFYLDLLPFLVVAIGYDLFRYPQRALVTADRVLGCGLRDLELALFSVERSVTAQDWFAAHSTPALDLLLAVPYLIFVYVVLGYGVWLYFVDRRRMRRFLWAFAVGNFIAFGVWLLLPAAPPWYLRDHGCTIDASAAPSAAALTRVDALLGIHYFEAFYSRASSVFGALPSMHCAFPVMGLITAWKVASWKTRPIHIGYALLMAVAAVYLDHHWIVDVLAGWGVASVSVWIASTGLARVERRVDTQTTLGPNGAALLPVPVPARARPVSMSDEERSGAKEGA